MGIKKIISNSEKKFRKYSLLLATFTVLFFTTMLLAFVYQRFYKLTERSCWNGLYGAAETIATQFSTNLQYQSLFLKENAEIIEKNKWSTKEEIIHFLKNYSMSEDVYELYVIFPDSTIYSVNGGLYTSEDKRLFVHAMNSGEHFSKITSNIYNPTVHELRHYYPIKVDGKNTAVLYSTIDLDFLSVEGVVPVYDGRADYIIFNPYTYEIYVNTHSNKIGNLISFMSSFRDGEDTVNDFLNSLEIRQTVTGKLKLYRENRSFYLFSQPLTYEEFSVCILSEWDVLFHDIKFFKYIAIKAIAILAIMFILYFILMIHISNRTIEVSLLEEKVRKAETVSKYKTIFLSEMSHDIRTPMNAIVGYINLAIFNIANEVKVKHYLSKCLIASNHLLSLINEILDISRIESGKIQISNAECDLKDVIGEIKNIISVQSMERHQNFYVDHDHLKNQYVLCDKLHLNQILINILGNAVKYTPNDGEISLTIKETEVTSDDRPLSEYEFIIKDNGIGMNSEFLKHVFEPFVRQKNIEDTIIGTGLGLAICKQLVEKMEGSIDVKSAEDVGTEISIKIKFIRISKDEYEMGRYISLNHEKLHENELNSFFTIKTVQFYKDKTILLVDDNDFNREISTDLLTQSGFKVEEAKNGQEAFMKVAKSEPGDYAAVLMDIQMPVMNGYEATEAIRGLDDPLLAEIPIIALSANAFDEDLQKAKIAGMNAYILKPINLNKLFKVLEETLKKTNEKDGVL